MTILPRSLVPLRTSNVIRRGRINTQLQDAPAASSSDTSPPGGDSAPPQVPLAYLYQTVKDYADAHPADFATACPYGAGTWAFLDGLVAALHAIDERVGFCWRPERNNFGGDVVAYYHGPLPPVEDSPDVYTVDVIFSACGFDAHPTWNDVTSPAIVRQWRSTR